MLTSININSWYYFSLSSRLCFKTKRFFFTEKLFNLQDWEMYNVNSHINITKITLKCSFDWL